MGVLSLFSAFLLIICGIYFTAKSKFFQFLHLKTVFKVTVGRLLRGKNLSGFKAMSLALGSTIGIGNIIGVTAAILVGGSGAVFWMLITGFTGMIIKYAEIYISVSDAKNNNRKSGGPMYVLSNIYSGKFKHGGYVFAVVTVLASFFAGNILQSKSIYKFAEIGFNISFLPITVVLIPLLFIIISGKDRVYQNVSSVLVPLMSLFYVGATLMIIFTNIKNLPNALFSIFTSAFGFKQAVGGFSGAVLSSALKTGVMKGLFTHEAGMGSSPIAHSSAENADPFCQSCWGIVEVFFDTVVVCMLTALAVLSSPDYLNSVSNNPFDLIFYIFRSAFGSFGAKALSISACCFAFASIIGWSFYGIKSMQYLTENSFVLKAYKFVFVLIVPMSLIITDQFAWTLTDLFNSLMLIINSILLLVLGGEAVAPLGNFKSVLEFKVKKRYNHLIRR